MKILRFYIIIFCFSISAYAQIEIKTGRTIDFSGLDKEEEETSNKASKNDLKKSIEIPETPNFISPESFSGLNYESKLDTKNFGTLNPVKMEFGVAPTVNKHLTHEQPNYLKKEEGISAYYQRDQKMGDFRTKSKFLIIRFRDHSNIDGDIVRLIINDEVKVHRAVLGSGFSEVKVDLSVDGFYKIDFMAVNMGQYAPNTAQLKITGDKNEIILNDKWALSTGFKATVVIIKE